MNYNFRKDLEDGKKGEKAFARLLKKKNPKLVIKFNFDRKYDLIVKGKKTYTYEVKTDFRAHETGNVVIEYESRGKLSGISTSEATYWVYKIQNDFYVIPSYMLRRMITRKEYFRTVTGGDWNSGTKMYMFKLDKFKKYLWKH